MLRVIFNHESRAAISVWKSKLAKIVEKDEEKIVSQVYGGAAQLGNRGNRLWPNSTRDAEVGIRFDWGDLQEDEEGRWRAFNLQVNKNAAEPTLKELGKNSHDKRVSFQIQVDAEGNPVMTKKDFWYEFVHKFISAARRGGV